MSITATPDMRELHGDWRRRTLSKTDAHLYRPGVNLPSCGRAIDRSHTSPVRRGRPCRDCLVAEITRRLRR